MKKTAGTAALILVVGPVLLLIYQPNLLTPLVSLMINAVQFFLALWLGHLISTDAAKQSANAKWLPPAESACDRLLTLTSSISSLQKQMKGACDRASTDLPELKEPKNKSVRLLLDRQCCEVASRLLDIQQHLEGAFEDWQRFIRQNCEGRECQRIWHSLNSRRARLAVGERAAGCGAATSPPAQPTQATALSVMVVAPNDGGGQFTLLPTENGHTWSSSAFVLTEESGGWRLSDVRNSSHFYWKEKSDESSVTGMYFPCAMCPSEGWAVVTPATTASEVDPVKTPSEKVL
ncbi:MAG TPA: hypothetical protein VHD56_08040 [Tepidisphaeraceae bacterium]|nr:hypothetical protein [Tepidisphaeraceae bacterium]